MEDLSTREKIEKFGNSALKINGLDNIQIGTGDEAAPLYISNKDAAALKIPEQDPDDTETNVSHTTLWLRLVTVQFEEQYKWRFTDGGERKFTAEMEDTDFLNQVLNGDINLSANDALKCRIREEQEISSGGLTKTVYVEEVLEYKRGDQQLRLI
ncbi:MAG: hypothetical protein AAF724_20320 [Pseudomonadota bacterium]